MKIRNRNFLIISGFVTATFAVVAIVLFFHFGDALDKTRDITFGVIRSSLIQKTENRTRDLTIQLSKEIAPLLASDDIKKAEELLRAAGREPETAFACVFGPSGNILMDGKGNTSPDRNIRELFGLPEHYRKGLMIWNDERTMVYSMVPFPDDSGLQGGVGIIRSAFHVDNALDSLGEVLATTQSSSIYSAGRYLVLAAVVLMVIVLIFSYAFSGRISRPMVELAGLVEQLGTGNFDIDVPSGYRGEIRDLAETLRRTAQKMKKTTVKRNYLRDILQNMHEGIIVVNSDGMIQFVNRAFTELSDCPASKLLNVHINSLIALLSNDEEKNMDTFTRNIPDENREICLTTAGGKKIHFSLNVSPLSGKNWKDNGAVYVFQNITEYKQLEKQLRHNSLHDSLTGLPNRSMLLSTLDKIIDRYFFKEEKRTFDILFVDLDGFKEINDNLGHGFGDELLKIAAQRLVQLTRPFDLVARYGGDEFVVLLDNKEGSSPAESVAQRLIKGISKPFALQGRQLMISACIGIVHSKNGGRTSSEFLENADRAMYQAKLTGKGSYAVFQPETMSDMKDQKRLATELESIVEEGEPGVSYQLVTESEESFIAGFETLPFVTDPDGKKLFLHEMEDNALENFLFSLVYEWTLERSIENHVIWHKFFPDKQFINFFGTRDPFFTKKNIYEKIVNTIAKSDILPSAVAFEVTESMIISNPACAAETLSDLRDRGFRIVLDHFGSGYTSINILHHFPFDFVKIEPAIVSGIAREPDKYSLLMAIVELARRYNIKIIAPGVESSETAEEIAGTGCHLSQGKALSGILEEEEITKILKKGKGRLVTCQKLNS